MKHDKGLNCENVSETVFPQLLVQSGTPKIFFPIARYPTFENENKTKVQLMAYED
jgi:hypothetical protein